jgi:hypothetical protein
MCLSETLKKLTEDGYGYRNETCYGSGVRTLSEVIYFEIEELGNIDIITTMATLYNPELMEYLYEEDGDSYVYPDELINVQEEILKILESKMNTTRDNLCAIWLTTEEAVETLYCNQCAETDIRKIKILNSWLPISDIGYDGILFVYNKESEEKIV